MGVGWGMLQEVRFIHSMSIGQSNLETERRKEFLASWFSDVLVQERNPASPLGLERLWLHLEWDRETQLCNVGFTGP